MVSFFFKRLNEASTFIGTSVNLFRSGGDKRDRTADLLNAIQALSQLSYTPISSLQEVVGQNGLESRLLATVRWTVATGVAFPQKSKSISYKRLNEALLKESTSLSLLEIQPCTLKTEHCDYDAIMRRQQ